jgi:hypothetical protein
MDEHYQNLKSYITTRLQTGAAPDAIRQDLVQHNWDPAIVDRALTELVPTGAAPIPAPQAQPTAPVDQTAAGYTGQAAPAVQQTGPYAQPQASPADPYATSQPQVAADPYAPVQAVPQNSTVQQPGSGNVIPKPTPKYKVFTAVADTIQAIRRNLIEYIAVAAIAIAIVLGVTFGLVVMLTTVVFGKILGHGGSIATSISLILTIVILYYAISTAATTLLQIVTNTAIAEGADGKRTSIAHIVQSGIRLIGKVLLTNLLVGLVAVAPLLITSVILIVGAFASLASGLSGTHSSFGGGSLIVMILLQMIAILWIIFAMFRFALAPIVAMFEPGTSPWKSLGRSHQLLQGGGKWFLFKGSLLVLAVVLLLALVTGQSLKELQGTSNIAVNAVAIIIEVLANGALVMLYRNRRMVKDTQTLATQVADQPARYS